MGAYPMVIIMGIVAVFIKRGIVFEQLMNLIAKVGETGSRLLGKYLEWRIIPV
jgi:hypothetical protein